MVTVSFPGLGITFNLNPVALRIPIFGGLEIRWYAIIIVTGMIAAFLYASYRAKDNGLTADNMFDVGLTTIIVGIIGARLYYVFANIEQYKTFKDVIAIWEGGLAIYGGIIAGGLTLFAMCKIYNLDWRCVFDTAAPGVMIAQAIGRWGNFVNGEAYGVAPSESNPLYFLRMAIRHENWSDDVLCAPTFLYESLWNVTGFILINIFYKRRKFRSEVFLWYATWYGFGRFFIEGLRTDSLYAGELRVSQVVAGVSFVVGLTLIITIRTLIHLNRLNTEMNAALVENINDDDPERIEGTNQESHEFAGAEDEGTDEPEVEGPSEPEVEGPSEPEVEGPSEPEVEGQSEPEVEGPAESEADATEESEKPEEKKETEDGSAD